MEIVRPIAIRRSQMFVDRANLSSRNPAAAGANNGSRYSFFEVAATSNPFGKCDGRATNDTVAASALSLVGAAQPKA